jgi:hypothetical protein
LVSERSSKERTFRRTGVGTKRRAIIAIFSICRKANAATRLVGTPEILTCRFETRYCWATSGMTPIKLYMSCKLS